MSPLRHATKARYATVYCGSQLHSDEAGSAWREVCVLRELGESSLFFSHFEQTAAGPANMLRLPSRAGSHVRKPVRPARIDVRKLHSAYIRSVLLSWHQQKVLLPHRSAIVGCQQRRRHCCHCRLRRRLHCRACHCASVGRLMGAAAASLLGACANGRKAYCSTYESVSRVFGAQADLERNLWCEEERSSCKLKIWRIEYFNLEPVPEQVQPRPHACGHMRLPLWPQRHPFAHAHVRRHNDGRRSRSAFLRHATHTVALRRGEARKGCGGGSDDIPTTTAAVVQDHGLFSMYSSYLVQCSYATDSLDRNLLYFWHGLFCNRVQRMVWRLEASRAAYCAPRRVASDVASRSLPAASRNVAMLHAVSCLRSHSAPGGTVGFLRVATFDTWPARWRTCSREGWRSGRGKRRCRWTCSRGRSPRISSRSSTARWCARAGRRLSYALRNRGGGRARADGADGPIQATPCARVCVFGPSANAARFRCLSIGLAGVPTEYTPTRLPHRPVDQSVRSHRLGAHVLGLGCADAPVLMRHGGGGRGRMG